ncbi:hypothetical protein [Vibrio tasmaniensis]|uniref:hypothetical protein n=1 Tax=Vibrio tasmaniensis TaxID=212663 RepID=UPI0010802CA3|nr:hypothetical protein [Vibrio tasmaniensis]
MKSSSLDFLPDADIDSISKLLPSLREDQNLMMKIMNVGQGNSVSFVEETIQQDLFYVDVGGGILRNRSSYKDSKIEYNPVEDALIILTHWDMDHWVSLIRKSDSLKNTKLLAPRQKPIGLSHVKLAADLESQNRLLIWPESNTEIIGELVDVYKLKNHSVRNYSGLAVVAKTEPWREKSALITGDAPYSKCDFLNRYDVSVVVVPHHGGKFESDIIPQAPDHHISAYSYGANNSYGHPHSETKIKHNKRGWNNEFNTVDSDILIINEKSVFSNCVMFHELCGSQVVNISNK